MPDDAATVALAQRLCDAYYGTDSLEVNRWLAVAREAEKWADEQSKPLRDEVLRQRYPGRIVDA